MLRGHFFYVEVREPRFGDDSDDDGHNNDAGDDNDDSIDEVK